MGCMMGCVMGCMMECMMGCMMGCVMGCVMWTIARPGLRYPQVEDENHQGLRMRRICESGLKNDDEYDDGYDDLIMMI